MTLIKPTIIESLFYQFFRLDPSRPSYYLNTYTVARSIFKNLKFEDKAELIRLYVQKNIEYKYKTDLATLAHVYDNANMSMRRGAYIKIGSGINSQNVGLFEVKRSLEDLKVFIQDEVVEISTEIRFTSPAEIFN